MPPTGAAAASTATATTTASRKRAATAPPAAAAAATSTSATSTTTATRARRSADATTATTVTETTFKTRRLPHHVVSVATEQGPREYQEDRFDVACLDGGAEGVVAVGVFDGHGGKECSEYLESRLLSMVLRRHVSEGAEPHAAIMDAFAEADAAFCALEERKRTGAGSTATVALARRHKGGSAVGGKHPKLGGKRASVSSHDGAGAEAGDVEPPPSETAAVEVVVGFAGDSRAAVLRRGTRSLEFLSVVHHGTRRDERRRIERLGGYVLYDEMDDVYRVGGVLAVTRSIGDAYLKPFVTGEPEIKSVVCGPGDLLVVASDGLWDHASEAEIADTLRRVGGGGEPTTTTTLTKCADDLVKLALESDGDDNVTVVVLDLSAAVASVSASPAAAPSAGASS